MLHFNSGYIFKELKEIQKSENNISRISEIIKEEAIQSCLEITSIETFFGKFSNDLDQYFTNFPLANRNNEMFYMLSEISSAHLSKYFTQEKNISMDTNFAWDWIDQLMHCLQMHIESIKNYHQYVKKYNLCKNGLEYAHLFLKSIFENLHKVNLETVNDYLNDCLLIMFNITDISEDIFKTYLKVIPTRYRICTTPEMQAKVLINCCFDKVELHSHEIVIVLDKDFETNLWKIKKTVKVDDKVEEFILNVPSLFLILDGFDKEIIDSCNLMKRQIISTWELIKSQFRNYIYNSLMIAIDQRELTRTTCVDKNICYSILDNLIRSLELDKFQSEKIFQFRHQLENMTIENISCEMLTVNYWHCLRNAIQLFNDTKLYAKHFNEILNKNYNREECVITIKNPRYVTMAYISNITEEQATELELTFPTDKTITSNSDDTLNGTDDLSEVSFMSLPEEKQTNNNRKIESVNFDKKYTSSYHLYLNEYSIKPMVQTVTIIRPNPFIAEPTTDTQIININFEKFETIIIRKSFKESENNKSIIYGIINKFGEILNIFQAINENILNVKDETFFDAQFEEEISWDKAYQKNYLLTMDIPENILTTDNIKCGLAKQLQLYLSLEYKILFEGVQINDVIFCKAQSENEDSRTVIFGWQNQMNNEILGINEAIKENLIKVEYQTCRCNRENKDEMSWKNAIEEKLMIACEINKNIITEEYMKCLIESNTNEYINTDEMEILGAVNTRNNKLLETNEAIEGKILDLNGHLFMDELSKGLIPLRQAIDSGYVMAKKKDSDCELHRVFVGSVKVGKDQHETSLEEAIKAKVIDQLENFYRIEEENIEIRIMDAIMLGMIKIEDKNVEEETNPKCFAIVQRKPTDPEIKELCEDSSNKEVNMKILCKAIECDCMNEFLIYDDVKESIAKSIFENHLELDPMICDVDGEKQSILKGFVKGVIDSEEMKRLLEHVKDLFVGEMLETIDEDSNGKEIIEALNREDLKDKCAEMLIIDEKDFTIESVSKIDANDENKKYRTKINVGNLLKSLNQLRCFDKFGMDTIENAVIGKNEDSKEEFEMTIFESVMNGTLDLDELGIFDEKEKEMCSMIKSVERGLIDVKAAENILDCLESMSFEELIKAKIFDIENNCFDKNLSLEEAIEEDLLRPEVVYLNLCEENKVINLSKMIECGMLNASENLVKIEKSDGEIIEMKLNEAVKEENGILSSVVNSEEMKKHFPRHLKDLLENGEIDVNRDLICFVGNTVLEVNVKDAIEQKLASLESFVMVTDSVSDNMKKTVFFGNKKFIDIMLSFLNLRFNFAEIQKKCASEDMSLNNFDEISSEFKILSQEKHLLFNNFHELFNESFPSSAKALTADIENLSSQKEDIDSLFLDVQEFILNYKVILSENQNSSMANSLQDSINKLKLKLNTMFRQIKKYLPFKKLEEVKGLSQKDMLETIDTLKSYQPDLSFAFESINKFEISLANVQAIPKSSIKALSIEEDLFSLKELFTNIFTEVELILNWLENLLSEFSARESDFQDIKFNLNEFEIKFIEEMKFISISGENLCRFSKKLSVLEKDLLEIEQSFKNFDKDFPLDFKEIKLFESLNLDCFDLAQKIFDLKTGFDVKLNLLSQTKTRLAEFFQISNKFNETLDKLTHELGLIKSNNKTDKSLQDIINLRKEFIGTLDEFERIKISCESYINNSFFQDKEDIINLYNNTKTKQKDLYLRINEELVFQVESKISLLLIELGKLQIFVMDLPKNWDTNVSDIKNRIDEIKIYLDNLHIMEKDLQGIDKALSEDLSDQLEINFELLEKAITNIQYCEKERLLTYTDLDKIYNIILNNYLPTIITYENNKQLAESIITETNISLEEFIKDFNNYTTYTNDNETPFVIDAIKYRKSNLQKLENILYEIEPLVEAVESYGFDLIEQLIELTSDYGSDCSFLQSIKDDIQEIRNKFRTLKNQIADLDSKIIELLSPNSKSHILEKLTSEYEIWHSLNDVLIKLDPVQSFPEKFNKQFEEVSFLYDQVKKKEIAFHPLKQAINKLLLDDNMSCTQDDIKEQFDDIGIDNEAVLSNDADDLKDHLKEVECLIESVFYKVDNRMSILNELKDLVNLYWSEISEIFSSIKHIQKNAMSIEAFPYNKDDKNKILEPQIAHSDSISTLTDADNKSTTSSVGFELDEKFDEDSKLELPNLTESKFPEEIISQDLVKQQYSSLKKMGKDVTQFVEKLETDLVPKANQIVKIGGQFCELEISEFTESLLEEIGITEDAIEEKDILFNKALYFVDFLSDEIKKVFEWFEVMENRLINFGEITPDQKLIEINLLELKSLNTEIFSKAQQLDKIGSAISEILSYPYVPNKNTLEEMKLNIKEKYSELVKGIIEKHNDLQKKYSDIGELDFSLDDNIGILQEFENQIKNLTPQSCKGDPEYTYSCFKNLKFLDEEFNGLQSDFQNLCERISAHGDIEDNTNLRCRGTLSIFGKLKEMKILTEQIRVLIPEKYVMIQEILKNEKLLSKEIHLHIDYLEKLNNYLKLPPKLGFSQESVEQSNLIFSNYIGDLNKQRNSIENSLKLASSHIESCQYDKCTFLSTAIKTLFHKYKRCQHLAAKRKEKLSIYSKLILEYDADKQTLQKDILELENLSIKRMNPSKITVTCAEQIKSIKISIQTADKNFDIYEHLTIRSFDIKCFGNRIDNSQLILELKEYGLKLAKIQKRLRERIRIFNQAYREDKLFSDSYANLNAWLDESYVMIENFKDQPTKVLDHLDKLKNLCKQLSCQYANFHCTLRYGSYLKDKCTVEDPEKYILLEMLKTLRAKWNKIRISIVTEKSTLNRKLIKTGNIYDAMKCVNYWINDSIAKFVPDLKLLGDLDTVEVLIDECHMTENEINNHKEDFKNLKLRMLNEIKNYEESDIRNTIEEIENQFSLFVNNVQQRSKSLQESLQLAKEFNSKLNELDVWLRKAEKLLKIKSLPKFQNEADLVELIEKHEFLVKQVKEMKTTMTNFNNIGKVILTNCHPMATNYVNRLIFKTGSRWNQINSRSEDRSKKLNESLGSLRGSTALIEELIYKVGECLNKIQNEIRIEIPCDVQNVNDIINKHLIFINELSEIDSQIKSLIKDFKLQNPSSFHKAPTKRYHDRVEFYKNIWRNSKDSLNKSTDDLSTNTRLNFLNTQFNKLWKLSIEHKVALQNHLMDLNEKEQLRRFDFNTWKKDFLTYIKVKGLRLTDLFRRQQSRRPGYHVLEEFTNCIIKSGFPTNKYLLQQVFNIFNKNNNNEIPYQDFIDSLRPERRSQVDKNINLNDKKVVTLIIHDIIEKEVALCTCTLRYYVKREGDNKYRFGQNSKLYMVRYLNSTVMVRIGGGWQTITEFLKKNDPCRIANSLDLQKSKSMKMSFSTVTKVVKTLKKTDEKPTVKKSIQYQKASSLSSRIPTGLSKK